jgi:hypothetical protein
MNKLGLNFSSFFIPQKYRELNETFKFWGRRVMCTKVNKHGCMVILLTNDPKDHIKYEY